MRTTQRLLAADEWSPRHSRIEVGDSAPGLTPALENAALTFANGQTLAARGLLEEGIASDPETERAVLAWLALFDLLHRLGDRAAFEQRALQFVVAFERSAPTWEDRRPAAPLPGAALAAPKVAAVALTAELSARSAPQIEALRRAGASAQAPVRLEVSTIATVDDAGADLLAAALRDLRRRGVAVQIHGVDRLRGAVEAKVQTGTPSHQSCWMLLLEILQWQGDQAVFEERAVEFAITFELSPPSWESLAVVQQELVAEAAARKEAVDEIDVMAMSGVLCGSADPQVAKLAAFAAGRDQVLIDMSEVERIDFVCAGALYNAIQQLVRRDVAVHIAGATAIIRSLLLLMGIPPRHFAKRPQ